MVKLTKWPLDNSQPLLKWIGHDLVKGKAYWR